MNQITIVLSDSSHIGCQLLKSGIEEHSDRFVVVSTATTACDTIEAARQNDPHLILLSANLEDGPLAGLRALHELRTREQLRSRIVILLETLDRDSVIATFRGGAQGVFIREEPVSMLCRCIKCVHEGQVWADSKQLQYLLEAFASAAPLKTTLTSDSSLTERERQIAQLVAQGFSNRDISRKLCLSEHTVKNYLFRVFDKLGISSRVDLAMYVVHTKGHVA